MNIKKIQSIEDIDEHLLSDFATMHSVSSNDKTILKTINTDVLQIIPVTYPWALEYFKNGCANNWMPTEVNMAQDIIDWRTLSFAEKRSIIYNLGFFSTAESIIGNNGVLALYPFITNPEARMYILRQAFEEALHTYTFMTITQTLPINQAMVFNMHKNMPIIAEKDEFATKVTFEMQQNRLGTDSIKNIQILLRNIFSYYVVMEGIWFYGGFPQLLWFSSLNKMSGLTQQIQFILRDESLHVNFGVDLFNTIVAEYPEAWTTAFKEELLNIVHDAVKLEQRSIQFALPNPLTGLRGEDVFQFVLNIANRRLERVGLPMLFETRPALPWLNDVMDHISDDNFFERTVRSYRVDGLKFA